MTEIEIIPAINEEEFLEIEKKIRLLEPHSKWVHLDVADGTFTKNTLWHEPQDLAGLETPLSLEVHLMILGLEERIANWLFTNIKRIIFNLEASQDPDFVIEKIKEAKKEVGLSIGPDISWTRLVPYFNKIDLIQILSVYPGLPGQKFLDENLDKIMHIKKECQECIIEVDGGMNPKTAKEAIKAGADIIVSASYIWRSDNIEKAIENLKAQSVMPTADHLSR